MATSWTTDTKEKENYTKLCRLLYDGGTLAVRTVFDGICPPASLGATLKTNQHKLQTLKKPTGKPPATRLRTGTPKVLNQDQWDLLYPPSVVGPKSEDFDITLLFVLLRNICGLTPPATGWNALPPSTDKCLQAHLVRIKCYRNNVIAHSSKAEVDDTLFEAYWGDISYPLVSLGLKQVDIDELKSSPLGAKDYNQLVEYWDLSDAEITLKLEAIKSNTSELKADTSEIKTYTSDIKTDTSEIKTDTSEIKTYASEIITGTSEIKTDTSEIKSDTAEMKSELSDIKARMSSTQSEITKLAHIDFTSLIQKSCGFYHESSRQWILDQIEATVQKTTSRASVALIRAGPGMGKSIVAAKLCDIYRKIGFLGGCHFFQHNNSLRNNPKDMMQSIARQLCNSLTGYQEALEAKLKTLQGRNISDLNCEELFGLLFEEPLSQICINHNVVIVIDALDECASQFKEEFEDVLNRKLSDLPSWIRFVITTRPLPSCRNLSPIVQIEINPFDQRNVQDLREFFTFELAKRNAQNSFGKLMEISNGLFLVAHFVLEILDEGGNESIPEILECFPHGISSVYKYYFTRIQKIIKPYIHISESEDESFFKMLEAMVAAKGPIPKQMFYEILQLKSVEEVHRAKRMERNDAVHLLHTIFPLENGHVSVFHKSVTDWLNLDGKNGHQFSVSARNGCEVLAKKSLDVIKVFKTARVKEGEEALKEGGKPFDQPLVLSESERFALLYGLDYINKSFKLSQSVKEEINMDFVIVAAMLSDQHVATVVQSNHFPKCHPHFIRINGMANCVSSLFTKCPSFKEHACYTKKFPFYFYLCLVGDYCSIHDPSPVAEEFLCLRRDNKLPLWDLFETHSSIPSAFLQQSSSSFLDLFEITNGLTAVNVDPAAEPPTSSVLNIMADDNDNGSFGEQKTFSSAQVRGVSPDKKFLIITKTDSSKIELFDITTLEKVREYNCPVNCVDSCHIFGDEQWYIVVKAQGDPKIHILDGLNGQLHDTIEVGEDEEIEGVSQCGHILISHYIVKYTIYIYNYNYYDDEEDDDEEDDFNYDDTFKDEILFLKTIHFSNRTVKIYYYPPEVDNLHDGGWKKDLLKNFKFSDDGKYLSLYSGNKVHIFHTNDGTLYRIVEYNCSKYVIEIVFLSFSCLVVITWYPFDHCNILIFYDLLNSKVIYNAHMKLIDQTPPLVPPQHHTDESIPTTFFALTDDRLVKYECHNLELNL